MKTLLFSALLMLIFSTASYSASEQYQLHVDGMACPFCAYNIEKKFKTLDGASDIKVNLEQGLVEVTMADGHSLSKPQMQKLFEDAGFTFRSMSSQTLSPAATK